jgi:hypothetical protein
MKTPYDNLPLVPTIIADVVANREYTGQELSIQIRSGDFVNRIEGLRKRMSETYLRRFIEMVDSRCRTAYENDADWFMKIVHARGESGRNQIYIWVSHWLAGFLIDNEDKLMEQ